MRIMDGEVSMVSQRAPLQNLRGQVFQALGRRIVQGDLRPGQVLPDEHELSRSYQVSRTVLREAVKGLEARGLLESRPKAGTTIQPRSRWRLLDQDVLRWLAEIEPKEPFLHRVTEVRHIIEPAVAAIAASRATEEELGEIDRCFQRMRTAIGQSDIPAFIAADTDFHTAILTACHNELLEQMTETMRDALQVSRQVTTAALKPEIGMDEDIVKQFVAGALLLHEEVLSAIKARDADRARDATLVLLERVDDTLTAVFRQIGL